MKRVIILTSILLLTGCAINSKTLSPTKSSDDKIILEAEKYKQ
ncbi:energy transducer TonB, partial [Acinetobacter baumannii]